MDSADSLTDSIAAEIINICDNYYGHHQFFDESTNRYKAPLFIWKTDSSAVLFSYTSSELYNKMIKTDKRPYCYRSLTICFKLDKEDGKLLNQTQ